MIMEGKGVLLLLLSSRVRVGAVLLGWWVVGNGKFSLPQVRKNFLRIVAGVSAISDQVKLKQDRIEVSKIQ